MRLRRSHLEKGERWGTSLRRRRSVRPVALVGLAVLVASACGSSGNQKSANSAPAKPVHGGSLTVILQATTWPTLDPAQSKAQTQTGQPIFSAIYGQLFRSGAHGTPVPDLATGYQVSPDGKTVTITLRKGVTFQDGTPFDSQAVKASLVRDMDPSNGCICRPYLSSVTAISTPAPNTVVLSLSAPYAPLITVLTNTAATYIVSPAALQKEGASGIALNPVGAGPFQVQQNLVSNSLTLSANPHYYRPGYPLLSSLKFLSVNDDTTSYDSVLAGNAQLLYGTAISETSLTGAAQNANLRVVLPPTTWWDFASFGQSIAPFNNQLARQALFYATDPSAINKALYHGSYSVTQSMTGAGETLSFPTVPGYPTYDPTKAKQLVKQLGGLSFTMTPIQNSPYWIQLAEALQSQWAQVGIHASIQSLNETQVLQLLFHKQLQLLLTNYGGYSDPALSIGPFVLPTGAFNNGLDDPAISQLFAQANQSVNLSDRKRGYEQLFETLAQKADELMLFAKPVGWIQSTKISGIPSESDNLYLDAASAAK